MEGLLTPRETAELVHPALAGVSREELKKWYALMHLARLLDDKAPNYLKQGLGWSYHAPCAGHDAIQLALGMTFRTGRDYLFPYYRDLTTCVAAGLTAEEVLLNGMSKAADVASGGRHMSNHFAKPEIGIQNVSSSVSNHAQHAAGLARALGPPRALPHARGARRRACGRPSPPLSSDVDRERARLRGGDRGDRGA